MPDIIELKSYFDNESAEELNIYVINKYSKLNDDAKTSLLKYNNEDYINIVKKINIELSKSSYESII